MGALGLLAYAALVILDTPGYLPQWLRFSIGGLRIRLEVAHAKLVASCAFCLLGYNKHMEEVCEISCIKAIDALILEWW